MQSACDRHTSGSKAEPAVNSGFSQRGKRSARKMRQRERSESERTQRAMRIFPESEAISKENATAGAVSRRGLESPVALAWDFPRFASQTGTSLQPKRVGADAREAIKFAGSINTIQRKRAEERKYMSLVNELKERIIGTGGGKISREEALQLFEEPVEDVAQAADEIREKFCGNGFDICTIINGKSGRCSENCKFCAQSAHYNTGCTEVYDLLPTEDILREAKYRRRAGRAAVLHRDLRQASVG